MRRAVFFSLLAVSCSPVVGSDDPGVYTNLSCEEGEVCGGISALAGSAFAVIDAPLNVADNIRKISDAEGSPHSLAAGDIDGDGDIDLATINREHPKAEVHTYINNGEGEFKFGESIALQGELSSLSDLALVDLDNDFDPDLIVTWAGPEVMLDLSAGVDRLVNTGGQFEFQGRTEVSATGLADMSVADLNSDGLLDLVASDFSNHIHLFVNDGIGGFVTEEILQDNLEHITVGDFDGDKDVDIAGSLFVNLVQTHENYVVLYENDGAGHFPNNAVFQAAALNPAPNAMIADMVRADFDRDGDIDLISTNAAGDATLSVLLNDGTGVLGNPKDYDLFIISYESLILEADEMTIGDFDLDGDIDLAFEEFSDVLHVVLNDGAGGLAKPISFYQLSIGVTTRPVAADFNGDGRVDLAIALDYDPASKIVALVSADP